ncbi:hypothetical protein QR685DRAFT_318657 [Neurospora intermedia]|uniref:Secreted protein n=1 Tax=Neurospora intermedia TaxID=5142 RepID=A0ABR3D876_NEUIN
MSEVSPFLPLWCFSADFFLLLAISFRRQRLLKSTIHGIPGLATVVMLTSGQDRMTFRLFAPVPSCLSFLQR